MEYDVKHLECRRREKHAATASEIHDSYSSLFRKRNAESLLSNDRIRHGSDSRGGPPIRPNHTTRRVSPPVRTRTPPPVWTNTPPRSRPIVSPPSARPVRRGNRSEDFQHAQKLDLNGRDDDVNQNLSSSYPDRTPQRKHPTNPGSILNSPTRGFQTYHSHHIHNGDHDIIMGEYGNGDVGAMHNVIHQHPMERNAAHVQRSHLIGKINRSLIDRTQGADGINEEAEGAESHLDGIIDTDDSDDTHVQIRNSIPLSERLSRQNTRHSNPMSHQREVDRGRDPLREWLPETYDVEPKNGSVTPSMLDRFKYEACRAKLSQTMAQEVRRLSDSLTERVKKEFERRYRQFSKEKHKLLQEIERLQGLAPRSSGIDAPDARHRTPTKTSHGHAATEVKYEQDLKALQLERDIIAKDFQFHSGVQTSPGIKSHGITQTTPLLTVHEEAQTNPVLQNFGTTQTDRVSQAAVALQTSSQKYTMNPEMGFRSGPPPQSNQSSHVARNMSSNIDQNAIEIEPRKELEEVLALLESRSLECAEKDKICIEKDKMIKDMLEKQKQLEHRLLASASGTSVSGNNSLLETPNHSEGFQRKQSTQNSLDGSPEKNPGRFGDRMSRRMKEFDRLSKKGVEVFDIASNANRPSLDLSDCGSLAEMHDGHIERLNLVQRIPRPSVTSTEQSLNQKVAQMSNEIADLKRLLGVKDDHVADLAEAKKLLLSEKNALEKELHQAREKHHAFMEDEMRHRDEMDANFRKEMELKLKAAESALQPLAAKLHETEISYETAESQLQIANAKLQTAESQLQTANNELETLTKFHEDLVKRQAEEDLVKQREKEAGDRSEMETETNDQSMADIKPAEIGDLESRLDMSQQDVLFLQQELARREEETAERVAEFVRKLRDAEVDDSRKLEEQRKKHKEELNEQHTEFEAKRLKYEIKLREAKEKDKEMESRVKDLEKLSEKTSKTSTDPNAELEQKKAEFQKLEQELKTVQKELGDTQDELATQKEFYQARIAELEKLVMQDMTDLRQQIAVEVDAAFGEIDELVNETREEMEGGRDAAKSDGSQRDDDNNGAADPTNINDFCIVRKVNFERKSRRKTQTNCNTHRTMAEELHTLQKDVEEKKERLESLSDKQASAELTLRREIEALEEQAKNLRAQIPSNSIVLARAPAKSYYRPGSSEGFDNNYLQEPGRAMLTGNIMDVGPSDSPPGSQVGRTSSMSPSQKISPCECPEERRSPDRSPEKKSPANSPSKKNERSSSRSPDGKRKASSDSPNKKRSSSRSPEKSTPSSPKNELASSSRTESPTDQTPPRSRSRSDQSPLNESMHDVSFTQEGAQLKSPRSSADSKIRWNSMAQNNDVAQLEEELAVATRKFKKVERRIGKLGLSEDLSKLRKKYDKQKEFLKHRIDHLNGDPTAIAREQKYVENLRSRLETVERQIEDKKVELARIEEKYAKEREQLEIDLADVMDRVEVILEEMSALGFDPDVMPEDGADEDPGRGSHSNQDEIDLRRATDFNGRTTRNALFGDDNGRSTRAKDSGSTEDSREGFKRKRTTRVSFHPGVQKRKTEALIGEAQSRLTARFASFRQSILAVAAIGDTLKSFEVHDTFEQR